MQYLSRSNSNIFLVSEDAVSAAQIEQYHSSRGQALVTQFRDCLSSHVAMAEGLALAASIIAILQIIDSVTSVCYDYGAAAKDGSWELSKVRAEMESLRNVLETLHPLAEEAESASSSAGTRLPTLALLCGPRGLLNCCLDEVRHLDERLKAPSWSDGFGPKRKAFIQALRWPLNKAKTTKALDDISRYRSILNLAITADQK